MSAATLPLVRNQAVPLHAAVAVALLEHPILVEPLIGLLFVRFGGVQPSQRCEQQGRKDADGAVQRANHVLLFRLNFAVGINAVVDAVGDPKRALEAVEFRRPDGLLVAFGLLPGRIFRETPDEAERLPRLEVFRFPDTDPVVGFPPRRMAGGAG